MTLSIVIVNWNVCGLLRECLRSIHAQVKLDRTEWELFVVDNNSSDDSVDMIRREYPSVQLIVNQSNVGFGAANNQAYRRTRGRYILLLNPDTVLRNSAIDTLLSRMEAGPDIAALGCRLVSPDGSFQGYSLGDQPTFANLCFHFLFLNRIVPPFLQPSKLYARRDPNIERDIGWISGACLLLRTSALGEQLFDERFFMYCEDIEVCRRLAAAGWRVVYSPAAEVIHYDGASYKAATPDIQMHKVRSLHMFLLLHNGLAKSRACSAVIVLGFLLRAGALTALSLLRPSADTAAKRARTYCCLREAVRSLGAARVE